MAANADRIPMVCDDGQEVPPLEHPSWFLMHVSVFAEHHDLKTSSGGMMRPVPVVLL